MERTDLITLQRPVTLLSSYSVVGKKEHAGPLAAFFDEYSDDTRFGQKTWELAESEMQRRALSGAIAKTGISPDGIDWLFAGDLQNQCVASSYGLSDFNVPYIGIYGACSTVGEAILLSSALIGSGVISTSAVVSSSHFCTAERQFRFPLPYGAQRQPVAQRTVTGAGAFVLASEGVGPKVVGILPGRIVDKGITDANNMGAAMAPAAADTLLRFFTQSGTSPSDYDVIATGDLATEGAGLLRELLSYEGITLGDNYTDCGLMVYSLEEQDVHAGASGCGCAAVTTAGYFMKKLALGQINDMLLITTGALMSTGSLQQGGSIPGVAHLVHIKNL